MITESDVTFPTLEQTGNTDVWTTYSGLTIFQLFSKDAPDNIPDWFKHINHDKPDISIQERNAYDSIKLFPSLNHTDLEQKMYNKVARIIHDWELKDKKERYFQWRIFYARNLIAELNKENP